MSDGVIVDCGEYAKELRRNPSRRDFTRAVSTWELTADELEDKQQREERAQADAAAEAECRARRVEALKKVAEAAGLTPAEYAELHGLDGLVGERDGD